MASLVLHAFENARVDRRWRGDARCFGKVSECGPVAIS